MLRLSASAALMLSAFVVVEQPVMADVQAPAQHWTLVITNADGTLYADLGSMISVGSTRDVETQYVPSRPIGGASWIVYRSNIDCREKTKTDESFAEYAADRKLIGIWQATTPTQPIVPGSNIDALRKMIC